MKIGKKTLSKAGVLLIAAFFVISSSAVIADTAENVAFATSEKTIAESSARGEEAIGYFDPDTAGTTGVGLQGGTPPYYWSIGIRLTQEELAEYTGWDLIAVNVLHNEDAYEHWGFVEVYGEGTPTWPGTLLASVEYHFEERAFYRVELNESIAIDDHNELWLVCAWESGTDDFPGGMDGIPAVDGKGDFVFMNGAWSEIQNAAPDFDHNWCMEGIVEGEGKAELAIQNVKGPIGVKAEVKNNGDVAASNLEYTMTVTGGILGLIDKTIDGTKTELAPGTTESISSGLILGFGKIVIEITANADNAGEVTETKEGLVLGILVIGIK